MKKKERALIISQTELAAGIFEMRLAAPQISSCAVPGQFVMVGIRDESHILPRPISICEADKALGQIRLVYRIAGEGTREMSTYLPGTSIDLTGPLGKGYPLDAVNEDTTALIVGGGIGIPPLLGLSKALNCTRKIVLGYRDELFLDHDFESCGNIYISTDTGSHGVKGTVMDAISQYQIKPDIIFACGPLVMLKAVKGFAAEKGIPAFISLEERMACGIGACLGCVVKTPERDNHSNVNNTRVCTEGPVFDSREVLL
ncbi:MAG: dihydroorotate dehydrogenase electron transfer subunit [Lachnospiraceae bacterium]|nr:dihydroorotate dehydrogenase electron transfer subunit [Lachnospiraceae bacterium]